MKKYLLFIVFILNLLFPMSRNGLKAQESFTKHQFGFSYGLLPIIGTFENDDIVDAQPFVHDQIWMGCLNLNYNYRINKLHAIGTTVSWTRNKRQPIQYDNNFYTKDFYNYLTLGVRYALFYYNTDKISIYSAINACLTLYFAGYKFRPSEPNVTSRRACVAWPDYHIGLLGVRVGQKHAATFELGFGTLGLFQVGYNIGL